MSFGPTNGTTRPKYFNETDYYSAESIKEHLATLEEGGHLAIWREMSKIPALRHADEFAIRQEFLRRLNGQDMFGNTEPTWQENSARHRGVNNRPGLISRPGRHNRKDAPCETQPISRASTS